MAQSGSPPVDAKSIAHHYLEAGWVRGDDALVRRLVTEDFRFCVASEAQALDIERYLAIVSQWRSAFGDLTLAVRDLLQEGATVAAHYELSGRHVAPVYGVAASGRRGSLQIMSFMDFVGGRICAHRAVVDFVSSLGMGVD